MKRIKNFEKIKDEFAKVYEIINSVPSLKLSEIDVSKTFHICVDMVNGFVKFGSMSSSEVLAINEDIANFSKKCKEFGIKNFALCDSHPENCIEFLTYPVHCLRNTDESKLTDEINTAADFRIFPKLSVNGWLEEDFQKEIINSDADTFIITGDCTDMCVMQLALSLKSGLNRINQKNRIIIPSDLVATCTLPEHEPELAEIMALYIMKTNGIEIIKNIDFQ